MSALSHAQRQAIQIVPRITAALSILGSGSIIYSVLKGLRNNRNEPGRNLLAGLSFADLVSSFMYVIGKAAFPQDKGGHGNDTTCNVQGFLVNLQIGSALYSGFLSWYYCLYIRYHWPSQRLRKRFEPVAHATVWTIVLCIGIGSLAADLYQPHWIRCYYSTKGKHADLYMWAFFFAPIWTSMILGAGALLLIYCEVHRIESKSCRYRFSSSRDSLDNFGASVAFSPEPTRPQRRRSSLLRLSSAAQVVGMELPKARRVAYQGLGYTAAFLFNYLFPTISRIMQSSGVTPPYAIRILAVSTVSSQGFWNWIIYFVQPKVVCWMAKRKSQQQCQQQQKRSNLHADAVLCQSFESSLNRSRLELASVDKHSVQQGGDEEQQQQQYAAYHARDFAETASVQEEKEEVPDDGLKFKDFEGSLSTTIPEEGSEAMA